MGQTKVLGEKYGIAITRPFSQEMYEHNDSVAKQMKREIRLAVIKRGRSKSDLNEITSSITGYRFNESYPTQDMRQEMLNAIDTLQNWWLAQEYPRLVKLGYCRALQYDMIGF